MVNEVYPFSVFYITYPTFEKAGKKISTGMNSKSWDFLFKAVLMNIRYKRYLGISITFTTKQIAKMARDVEFENKFKGLMVIGDNMAEGEENEAIKGDKNYKLLQFANDKNVEITGEVKIICDDSITKNYFDNAKLEDDYPIEIIDSDVAYEELIAFASSTILFSHSSMNLLDFLDFSTHSSTTSISFTSISFNSKFILIYSHPLFLD